MPTDNTAASCTEAIRNVVEVEKVPVVAGEEGICSGCGVTTLSISYYELGRITGEMAFEVLTQGADISHDGHPLRADHHQGIQRRNV